MIERFNFYDVYGYLLPGAALLGLLLLPFGLLGRPLPALEWSGALVSLAAAYFAGHVLQILARRGLPEYSHQHARFLDPADAILPTAYRAVLQRRIRQDFDIDTAVENDRQLAFEMCRAAIHSTDTPSYAEQFQGLYALMRGLSAACLLGAAYHFGWALAPVVKPHAWIVVLLGVTLEAALLFTVIVAIGTDESRNAVRESGEAPGRNTQAALASRLAPGVLAAVALLLAAAGLATAVTLTPGRLAWQRVTFAIIPLIVLAFLFHRAHRAFASVFAKTVITAYMARPRPSS